MDRTHQQSTVSSPDLLARRNLRADPGPARHGRVRDALRAPLFPEPIAIATPTPQIAESA